MKEEFIISKKFQLSIPLDIPNVYVLKTRIDKNGAYVIIVESTRQSAVCQHCSREITRFHSHDKWIRLRHLPILGRPVYIRLRPKRYKCPYCDRGPTTTQQLDWYRPRSPHTKAYDQHLLLQLVNSTVEDVSQKEKVGYDAVVGAVRRHIRPTVNWSEYSHLRVLGIDEIALTKGRSNYAAIITTQQAKGQVAILTVLPDRKKETVRQFLDSIPPPLRATVKSVCTDMWDGYITAVQEFEQAHKDVSLVVVVDRFHVAKNYRDCVDTLRKAECRRLKKELPESEYESIKGVMWPCRKNNNDLTADERRKLNRLFAYSPALKAAYTLREELTAIFALSLSRTEALRRLDKWQAKVRQQSVTCFDKFLKTLHNHLSLIANYFINRLTSGFVEGLNNKIKTIKRRCYGISRIDHLFQRIYLDLEGYRLFA
jgi:transposase